MTTLILHYLCVCVCVRRVKEESSVLRTVKEGRLTGLVTPCIV